MEDLLTFMALQWTRVPSFRSTALRIAGSFLRGAAEKALAIPETWAAALSKTGIAPEAEGGSYEEAKEFHKASQDRKLTAKTDWFLKEAFEAMKVIVPVLRARNWWAPISKSGSFIATDNPVVVDGPRGEAIGFVTADIVMFPVNRHLLLWSGKERSDVPLMRRNGIAHINAQAMLWASGQTYSHRADFCWMDENRKYQTDWHLFEKKNYVYVKKKRRRCGAAQSRRLEARGKLSPPKSDPPTR